MKITYEFEEWDELVEHERARCEEKQREEDMKNMYLRSVHFDESIKAIEEAVTSFSEAIGSPDLTVEALRELIEDHLNEVDFQITEAKEVPIG